MPSAFAGGFFIHTSEVGGFGEVPAFRLHPAHDFVAGPSHLRAMGGCPLQTHPTSAFAVYINSPFTFQFLDKQFVPEHSGG